jgi:hypothetical protein
LAFSEIVGYSKVYNSVRLIDAVKAVEQELKELEIRIENKSIINDEILNKLKQSISCFKKDLHSSLDIVNHIELSS